MEGINDSLTSSGDLLAALASVANERKRLDATERHLITEARAQGIGWARIASVLGLRSRQAAEQRWLRLSADVGRDPAATRQHRARQRLIDTLAGAVVVDLREAVAAAHHFIDSHSGWDDLGSAAILSRATVSAALDAPPGGLFALTTHAVADLDALFHARPDALGWETSPPLARLRNALSQATPPRPHPSPAHH